MNGKKSEAAAAGCDEDETEADTDSDSDASCRMRHEKTGPKLHALVPCHCTLWASMTFPTLSHSGAHSRCPQLAAWTN